MHELSWTERTVASFHLTWPLTNHSIHRKSTMFNLLDDTSNMFHFFVVFVFVSTIHSFIQTFIHSFVWPFVCHFSWRGACICQTKPYTHSNLLACFLSVLSGNRYYNSIKKLMKNWFSNKKVNPLLTFSQNCNTKLIFEDFYFIHSFVLFDFDMR